MSQHTLIRSITLPALLCFLVLKAQAQGFSVESLFFLPEAAKETSGLIFLNDRLITHNDSGNEAALYEIDPETGLLIREVDFEKISNMDWEDLAVDQEFIYIADIGNNQGNRTDLKIYRIPLEDYLLGSTTITVDSILFSYQDQTDFTASPLTNFDAEALISIGDSLYIFTKNWADQHSNIYSLPKAPGTYQAKRIGRINTQGLISGGVYNPLSEEIILVGYNLFNAFLVRLWDYEDTRFDQGKMDRFNFDIQGSFQIEAIEIIDDTDYYITSETNDLGDARLWRVNTDFVVGLDDFPDESLIYPNPAAHRVYLQGLDGPIESIVIYNLIGERIKSLQLSNWQSTRDFRLDLAGVPQGIYHLIITTPTKEIQQKLIVDY